MDNPFRPSGANGRRQDRLRQWAAASKYTIELGPAARSMPSARISRSSASNPGRRAHFSTTAARTVPAGPAVPPPRAGSPPHLRAQPARSPSAATPLRLPRILPRQKLVQVANPWPRLPCHFLTSSVIYLKGSHTGGSTSGCRYLKDTLPSRMSSSVRGLLDAPSLTWTGQQRRPRTRPSHRRDWTRSAAAGKTACSTGTLPPPPRLLRFADARTGRAISPVWKTSSRSTPFERGSEFSAPVRGRQPHQERARPELISGERHAELTRAMRGASPEPRLQLGPAPVQRTSGAAFASRDYEPGRPGRRLRSAPLTANPPRRDSPSRWT